MLKTYELIERHFGWERGRSPRPSAKFEYLLDRALRSQGIVSLDSVCYLDAPRKPAIRRLIEQRVRRRLVPVRSRAPTSRALGKTRDARIHRDAAEAGSHPLALRPADHPAQAPKLFFGYEHRFEAYVPKEKRVFGYFALPVLVGDEIVAALDLKTDRATTSF